MSYHRCGVYSIHCAKVTVRQACMLNIWAKYMHKRYYIGLVSYPLTNYRSNQNWKSDTFLHLIITSRRQWMVCNVSYLRILHNHKARIQAHTSTVSKAGIMAIINHTVQFYTMGKHGSGLVTQRQSTLQSISMPILVRLTITHNHHHHFTAMFTLYLQPMHLQTSMPKKASGSIDCSNEKYRFTMHCIAYIYIYSFGSVQTVVVYVNPALVICICVMVCIYFTVHL